MFNAIGTAGTGLTTYNTWLDTIADNIANMNDTSPVSGQVFHEALHAGRRDRQRRTRGCRQRRPGRRYRSSAHNGVLEYEPDNPIADAQGYVRHADVNLSEQMGDMIMAQRAFQANASIIDQAKEAYQAALAIGKQ